MDKKRIPLIIHGHFYQPPREDPWTNEIENQPDAYPFSNWNDRITHECYGPNAFSRVLDKNGKIKTIINNYSYMSFNFGFSLLQWLEAEEPEIFRKILEADQKSIAEHQGHGNAIAQVFNHTILPLQNFEDKKIQIIWGLKYFENKFGRRSEGIWLSETAIDFMTIDLLIEMGIGFVILSPDQVVSYKKIEADDWTQARQHPIDTSMPYKIVRSHGEIAVFFFDKQLSQAVNFEHLLHNADHFADCILRRKAAKNQDQVIVIATDGEIYGHHEPFGDMCISSLIANYVKQKKQIQITNFGEYLQEHPPQSEVNLWLGEDELGSSWSCSHGVGRWYKDCGCHSGGQAQWNQKWRQPLREALDLLKKEIDRVYLTELSPMIDDPWQLLYDYIEFILAHYNIDHLDFIKKHQKKTLNQAEVKRILTLLEAQKYAQFMYTSCGWFYNDISGNETIQNLKYANKVIHLTQTMNHAIIFQFEEKLSEAQSNHAAYQHGKWLLHHWVNPHVQDIYHIANNFIAANVYLQDANKMNFRLCKNYYYKNFTINKIVHFKNIHKGSITIIDKRNRLDEHVKFILNKEKNNNYRIYLTRRENHPHFDDFKVEIFHRQIIDAPDIKTLNQNDLINDLKHCILECSLDEKISQLARENTLQIPVLKTILYRYRNMNLKLPKFIVALSQNIIESYFNVKMQKWNDFPTPEIYEELEEIFSLVNHFSIDIDSTLIRNKISNILYQNLSAVNDMFSPIYNQAVHLIRFCNRVHLKIEKSKLENKIFYILKSQIPLLSEQLSQNEEEEIKFKIMLQIRKIIALADIFNINVEQEKKEFFEIIEKIELDF